MILVIAGTNRKGSRSSIVAKKALSLISSAEKSYLDLSTVKDFGLSNQMYDPAFQSKEIVKIQEELIKKSEKWIVFIPEYNGGLPGIFKLFIDALSIRDKDQNFKAKEVMLVGIASGRAGNLRGLDYLTNCLHYLGMKVFEKKLPISSIHTLLENEAAFESTMKLLQENIEEFLNQ